MCRKLRVVISVEYSSVCEEMETSPYAIVSWIFSKRNKKALNTKKRLINIYLAKFWLA